MIKILGICGSPRKGATEYSLKESLKMAETIPDIETELILLRKKKIGPCLHCDRCIREESKYCLVYSDTDMEMYDKFREADGYIIATPVYSMSITPLLSSFINLMRPTWNILKKDPTVFWDRVGAGIAVGGTRHGGQELTLMTIHGFYHAYGIQVIGSSYIYSGGTVWSRDRKEEGAREDKEGMKTVQIIGQRLAMAAYQAKYGKEAFLELKGKIDLVI